jgi:hypothetical protein
MNIRHNSDQTTTERYRNGQRRLSVFSETKNLLTNSVLTLQILCCKFFGNLLKGQQYKKGNSAMRGWRCGISFRKALSIERQVCMKNAYRIVLVHLSALALLATGILQRIHAAQSQATPQLQEIYRYIEDSEYDIRQLDREAVYKAANRAQNLRFTFMGDSLAVEPRDYGERKAKPWEVTLTFEGASKGAELLRPQPNPVWKSERKGARAVSPDVAIEYQNEPKGLRQSLWILKRPAGDDLLTLSLKATSKELNCAVANNEVTFSDQKREAVLIYTDLNVFDANEKRLQASIVPLEGNRFAIVVDDSNATYPILVDPLNLGVKTYIESQSGSKFSYSIALYSWISSTRDEVGIIVGAPYYDTGVYTDAGKVFAYYAASSLPSTPTWTKEGNENYMYFGWSVASAGDVDGNSYDDVLIGAPGHDGGGSYYDCGEALLFTASSTGINSTASWTYTDPQAYENLGYSVAAVGDLNADGYMDFAVGAPDHQGSTSSDGAVFIFKGSSTGPVSLTSIIGASHSRLGFSLARAGDIDGNGKDDFVAGAPEYTSGGSAKGAAYVFFSSGTSYSSTVLVGENAGDKFGYSVAGPQDVDGNGYPDVLVGAPYYDNGQTDEGKIYLYTGTSSGINTMAYFTDESNQSSAHLGWSVGGSSLIVGNSFCGDVDLDNTPDFVAGAPDWDSSLYTDCGKAQFYIGGSTPTASTPVVGLFNSAHTGTSVAVGIVLYRTGGVAVGTPTGVNAGDAGGTVQLWRWQ